MRARPTAFVLVFALGLTAWSNADAKDLLATKILKPFLREDFCAACDTSQQQWSDAQALLPLSLNLSDKQLRQLSNSLTELLEELGERRRSIPFAEVAGISELSRITDIRVEVVNSNRKAASYIPPSDTILVSTALIRYDLEAVFFTPKLLCGFVGATSRRKSGTCRMSEAEARGFDGTLELICAMQILHEVGHLVMRHDGRRVCLEEDADVFAISYLNAIDHWGFWAKNLEWPASGTWPATARTDSASTHPERLERLARLAQANVNRMMGLSLAQGDINWFTLVLMPFYLEQDQIIAANRIWDLVRERISACDSTVSTPSPSEGNKP